MLRVDVILCPQFFYYVQCLWLATGWRTSARYRTSCKRKFSGVVHRVTDVCSALINMPFLAKKSLPYSAIVIFLRMQC